MSFGQALGASLVLHLSLLLNSLNKTAAIYPRKNMLTGVFSLVSDLYENIIV